MMLIFGIFIVLASIADMVLSSFSISKLILLTMGLLLTVMNIINKKPGFIKNTSRLLLSLIVIAASLLTLNIIITENESMDKEVADVLSEAETLEKEEGLESALDFLNNKNMEMGWTREIFLAIGEINMDNEMYGQAAKSYYDILKNTPDDIEIRHLYGNALFMNKDYNGALREGSHMAKLDPSYDGAYVLMGDAYRGLNDNIREIYYYKVAVGLDEDSLLNRIRLAEAYGNSHILEKAVEQYEIARGLADTLDENSMVYESYLRFAGTDDQSSQEVSQ